MTYEIVWDIEALIIEKEKGGTVNFKYWEKGGVGISYSFFGTYRIGVMYTLDYTMVTNPRVKSEDIDTELNNDIDVPMVDVRDITMKDGFDSERLDSPVINSIMHEAVDRAIDGYESKRKEDRRTKGEEAMLLAEEEEKKKIVETTRCDFCNECPCMWISERATVVAKVEMDHAGSTTVVNSTRRKTAYKHMFLVFNGGHGQKGVRKRLPKCVESGVRTVFPDVEFMGFKEE